jgi:hypothetical protein
MAQLLIYGIVSYKSEIDELPLNIVRRQLVACCDGNNTFNNVRVVKFVARLLSADYD